MKWMVTTVTGVFFLLASSISQARDLSFFNVVMGGIPANLSVTLCLNGKGPLSCQHITAAGLSLIINTTVPNHTYPTAGIKIDTPGYTLTGCTPFSNGYCLFSVSSTADSSITINPASTLNYWVATNGSDAAVGDFYHPFLTLQHAKEVVQNNPLRGNSTIYVNIKGGSYRLTETLAFAHNDSGTSNGRVVYRAAPNESPEISGAVLVTGWSLYNGTYNIWKAHTSITTPTLPRQLYVNGVRATRSRTPDYPNYYTPFTILGSGGYSYSYTSGADPQIPPNWQNPTVIEAVTVTQWKMMRCPVAAIIPNTTVFMQAPCWTNANYYPYPWNFHLLSWFENAYEFLELFHEKGQWYLNPVTQDIYYIPKDGEDMATAVVELPLLQTLIQGGSESSPVSYLTFDGLSFRYATWNDMNSPNSSNGYVSDQSGFHLIGTGHSANLIGHAQNVTRTPGNISFTYAENIIFSHNTFEHLGAAALDFGTGSQNNQILDNTFNDISSAAIQLGGVDAVDSRPTTSQLTTNNLISNNLITYTGVEFYDAAGIYIGFTTKSLVQHNDIQHVPWSGIAIGWGWGLLDEGGFPGLPFATPSQWGLYFSPSAAHQNQIISNRIDSFLEKLWDGGAIYSTGFTGTSSTDGQLIAYNVAQNKRPTAGGNTIYTDGGSRYDIVLENVSLNNPQGQYDFGPCGKSSSFIDLCTNHDPYGEDMGGCIPFGDLVFQTNYFRDATTFFQALPVCSNIFAPGYPINISIDNIQVSSSSEVPAWILNTAGRQ